ncbi:hypothetical protein Anapl_16417 [Anas platyrhynchos]|uniref:Uncharacterized protein n=1 Tax=Anas platyrhynchos TaxID=8839 RepID=R0K8G7_ANAPL|nr:hypothetical protein Anapl_16417 [Anas platyrhynchos]
MEWRLKAAACCRVLGMLQGPALAFAELFEGAKERQERCCTFVKVVSMDECWQSAPADPLLKLVTAECREQGGTTELCLADLHGFTRYSCAGESLGVSHASFTLGQHQIVALCAASQLLSEENKLVHVLSCCLAQVWPTGCSPLAMGQRHKG